MISAPIISANVWVGETPREIKNLENPTDKKIYQRQVKNPTLSRFFEKNLICKFSTLIPIYKDKLIVNNQ